MKKIKAIIALLFIATVTLAQDGNAGINEATNQVKSYFSTGTNLMYAIGAIVGLVGAIKVYKKWTSEGFCLGPVAAPARRARFNCDTIVHLADRCEAGGLILLSVF